ncbi:MAG: hypothetical protein IH802_12150 [Nitrospinae bacterium]|nr:hypothetical protein [Nitrospinota bacterium]
MSFRASAIPNELVEISSNIKQHLDIRSVQWIDQVWEMALHQMPQPLETKNEKEQIGADEKSAKEEDSTNPLTTH